MIDLHTHSTCSDGSDPPGRIVELAAEAGCTAVALTDHDGLSGIAPARAQALQVGIEFVPGCEVSCRFSPGTQHILCYFAEPGEGPLQDQLETLRLDRDTRNGRLIARLNELGIPITEEMLRSEAGDAALGRPHFAAVLVRLGVVASYQEAFDTLLAKGGPAYFPKAFIDAPTMIAAAKGSGALAVLAHPLSLGLQAAELERQVAELAEAGLAGLECWYGRYSAEDRQGLYELAVRHGLVATGGSDYHGTYKPDLSIGIGKGDLNVPETAMRELTARRP
ncbi:MAG TPA: PHP domain-containing protein [Acidimicrobiales bacterium]|nr:PHP domain-containing protein [Acidimicrobiales bacterium]